MSALAAAVRRRPARALVALLVLTAAAWGSLGTFDAQGQEEPLLIKRAHEGAYRWEPGKPVFILALGSDARRGNPDRTRADSIHIIAIDPRTDGAVLYGIPRDSYVPIPGRGRSKINAAQYFGGTDLMTRTVEALSGCRFQYVMLTAFEGFRRMVDEFGGVPVTVPGRMVDEFADINLRRGRQVLEGSDALGFARSRKTAVTPRGDFNRSEHQGLLMVGALEKAAGELAADPGKILKYLAIVLRNVKTEIPALEALRLGLATAGIDPRNVRNLVADGTTETVAGAGSIVRLTAGATNTMADLCSDGRLT